jgi:glutaredoxin
MPNKRLVEIFSADCPACEETIKLVNQMACPSCEVRVQDMNQEETAERARGLGIRTVPAVVVDGRLAECCRRGGVNESDLRTAGVGQAL